MMLLVVTAGRISALPTSSGTNAIRAGLSRQAITPKTVAEAKICHIATVWVKTAAPMASEVSPSTVLVIIRTCRLS